MKLIKAFIVLEFLLYGVSSHAQKKNLDSVLTMPDDTVKVNEFRYISNEFATKENYDSAIYVNQLALNLSDKIKSNEKIIQCFSDHYKILLLQDKDSLALNILSEAIKKSEQLKYKPGLSSVNQLYSTYYSDRGEWQLAIKYSGNVLLFCDSIKEAKLYAATLSKIGMFHNFMGNSNDGIASFMRGLKIAETAKDSFRISVIYNNMAMLYNNIGDADKSKEYCYKSIAVKKTHDQAGLYFPYQNLGYVYNTLSINYDSSLYYYRLALSLAFEAGNKSQLGNIYQNLSAIFDRKGMNDSSMLYAQKSLDIFLEVGNNNGIAGALNALGVRYHDLGEQTHNKNYFAKSLNYYNRALEYAEASGGLWKQNTFHNLAQLYESMDDFKNAYKYELLYREIKDTLLNEEIINNTTKLEAKFQNEKKQNEINQLNAEKEISTVKLARQKTINYSLAFIAILILIASALIYRNIQKKRTAEKQVSALEKQNAIETMRSKIASDVHDDMGANLTRIGLYSQQLLQMENFSEKEKQVLEKISLQSKEVITGMKEIIWASNPANDNLKSMLSFMRQYIDRFFDGTEIRTIVNFPHNVGEVTLHPEVRRNLFLILKESLNNSVKYSGTQKMEIDFITQNNNYNFNIKDFGKGIDDATQNDFSNGLNNMQMRAQQIQSVFKIITAPGIGVQISVQGMLY